MENSCIDRSHMNWSDCSDGLLRNQPWLDPTLHINVFAHKLEVIRGLVVRSVLVWLTYPTVSTLLAPAYKHLCSHKLEVEGLVVLSTRHAPAYKPHHSHKLKIEGLVIRSVYLTDLNHDCWRPTLGQATPSPPLLTSNPCMPSYKRVYPADQSS